MKKYSFLFLILFTGLLLSRFTFVLAQQNPVEINFFYSAICPHCAEEKEFLRGLERKYPEIEIKQYEVFYKTENQKILNDFYDKYGVPTKDRGWVPITFTGERYFVGFNQGIAQEIESCIEKCLGKKESSPPQLVKVPIFGELDISKMSLPALTAVLGTLDGFNPCAMWILVVLISLLLVSKSRKKIALIGGTFIFAEGLLYFLIMAAWLNVFIALGYIFFIRVLIGVFGIIFGLWRIRDFFLWKPGVCKVVDGSASQEKLTDKIKNVLKPTVLPATILGVVCLAFGVNLIEFLCSAGFPTIYTRILALQNLGAVRYYLYLVLYIFFYMLDDLIVFSFALITLKHFEFSDKYSRYSTLIAGLLIFILGVLLIFKPEFLMFG